MKESLTSYTRLRKLIKEALLVQPKKGCGCGCNGKCDKKKNSKQIK
jgi:hypothetical protein